MASHHEPDVQTPDAVPNAVPCRYCVTDLRDPLGSPGGKGRYPSGKECRLDRQTKEAPLKRTMPQCMTRRYCVTLGVFNWLLTRGAVHIRVLWGRRLSITSTASGLCSRSTGSSTCSREAAKAAPSVASSRLIEARTPSIPRALSTLSRFQWPNGTWAVARCPHGRRP